MQALALTDSMAFITILGSMFGIGRATSDTAHEIVMGKIDRNEGIAGSRYDGEFPKTYFDEFLDYCRISNDDFTDALQLAF